MPLFQLFDRFRGLYYWAGAAVAGVLGLVIPWYILKFVLFWLAAVLVYIGLGYALPYNRLLLKSSRGTTPLLLKILLAPFFIGSYIYNARIRRTDSVASIQAIQDDLFLGGFIRSQDLALLNELNINAVLDVTVEFDAIYIKAIERDITYYCIPIFDHSIVRLEKLHQAVQWIDEQRRVHKRVLIHCALGRGRSAMVLLAYLMYLYPEKSLRELLRDTQARRTTVKPNFRQLRLLEKYQASEFMKQRMSSMGIND